MKILYVDSGNVVSDTYMYQYYGDIYRELIKIADIHLYQGRLTSVDPLVQNGIDCVIFGLGYFTQTDPNVYQKIDGLDMSNIIKVCMLHKPQTMLSEKLNFCKINNFDLLFDHHLTYKENNKKVARKAVRFWFSATPEIYHPRQVSKIYDVGFSGASHAGNKISGPTQDLRNRIHEKLQRAKLNIFWNSNKQDDLTYRIPSVEAYATKINESNIWIATTGPTLDVSPRYFEVMLSKTLLMCNDMPQEYEGVFIDGFNCVTFKNDLSDFDDKLLYYLNNIEERQEIIERGYNYTINNHTCKHMALKILNEIKGIQSYEKAL